MIIRFVAIVMFALTVSACTTPDYSYRPNLVNVSEPPLSTVVTASVGDTMVKQGTYTEKEAIKLDHAVKISALTYTLTPGVFYKQGQSAEGSFYYPGTGSGGGSIQKTLLADPYQAVFLKNDDHTICVVTVFNVRTCQSAGSVLHVKVPEYSENSFQQTLIYLGRSGDKINVGYREFSANSARPAFNNDVEYDLKISDQIAYKGAKIRIIEADNERIKYTVLSNFNSGQ